MNETKKIYQNPLKSFGEKCINNILFDPKYEAHWPHDLLFNSKVIKRYFSKNVSDVNLLCYYIIYNLLDISNFKYTV